VRIYRIFADFFFNSLLGAQLWLFIHSRPIPKRRLALGTDLGFVVIARNPQQRGLRLLTADL